MQLKASYPILPLLLCRLQHPFGSVFKALGDTEAFQVQHTQTKLSVAVVSVGKEYMEMDRLVL